MSQTPSSSTRLSIGVPVFNGERFLGEALDALLAQTFQDFVILISDNASTDATVEIVNYGFRHGPREVIEAVARGETVDPADYYMRTHARLETGDARYGWLNHLLFVGVGARQAQSVQLDLYILA